MRALSVHQPHAEAILRGIKDIEWRTIRTKIRERFYVYATKAIDDDVNESMEKYGIDDVGFFDLPLGMLIGTVELVDCIQNEEDPGWYEWHLSEPERIEPKEPDNHPQPVWFNPFG